MRIKIRTLAALASIAALGLGAAACGDDDDSGAGGSGPIHIGMVAPLTGPYAPIGTGNRLGAEAAVRQINEKGGIDGRKLQLTVLDAGTDPSRTVQQTQKILDDDKYVAVIGVGFGSGAVAAAPRANAAKIPYISMSAANQLFDPVQQYVFGVTPSFNAIMETTAKSLADQNLTKVAVLHDNSAASEEGTAGFLESAKKYNVDVVANETFGLEATSFTPSLTKIRNSGAQALVLVNVTPQALAVTKEWKQLRLPQRLVLSAGNNVPIFLNPACPVANGALISSTFAPVHAQLPDDNPAKKVAAEAAAAIGPKVDEFTYNGWGGIQVLQAAIEKGGEATREKIAATLQDDFEVVIPDGVTRYTSDSHVGRGPEAIVMGEITDCKVKLLPGQDLSGKPSE